MSRSQWKSARTTNAIEPFHEEYKRRIKTPTVLPSAETAAMLFWALLASGQITMCKVDGWRSLTRKPADKPIDLDARPPILIQSETAPIKFQHKSRRHPWRGNPSISIIAVLPSGIVQRCQRLKL